MATLLGGNTFSPRGKRRLSPSPLQAAESARNIPNCYTVKEVEVEEIFRSCTQFLQASSTCKIVVPGVFSHCNQTEL